MPKLWGLRPSSTPTTVLWISPIFQWPDPETWPEGSILFLHPLDFERIARMEAVRERHRRSLN